MREIKFRGKDISGSWVHGYYIGQSTIIKAEDVKYDFGWIDESEVTEVVTKTIGQFTGLTDRKGKEIYEGDIVANSDELGVVQYLDATFCVNRTPLSDYFMGTAYSSGITNLQVIGNIHDNPELVGESI